MKGPTASAVFNATRILLESTHRENKEIREATLNRENVSSRQCSLDDANHKISALELTLDAVRGEFASKIQEARRKRNAFLPISRLPRELLAEIFYIQCDTYNRFKQLKNSASVCSEWLTVVRSTPMLWSVLDSNCPLDLLPVVIRNSKSSPLRVQVFWPSFDSSNPPPETIARYRRFFEIVAADSRLTDRWSSVSMLLPPNVGPIKDYLGIPLLNLRRAYFRNNTGLWTQGPVKLLGGDCGRLEEFDLEGIPVQWDAFKLKGLRLLSLKYEAPSSSTKLLEMLAASPELESLTLSDLPTPSNSERDVLHRVTLPQLRKLVLSNNEEKVVVNLLRSIKTPPLKRFELIDKRFRRQDYGDAFVSALDTFDLLAPTLQSIILSAHDIELELGGIRFQFGASGAKNSKDWGFHIDLQTGISSKIFTWMSRSIVLDPDEGLLASVKVAFNSGWANDNDTTAFLPVMEWVGHWNVGELVLNDNSDILKWLSEQESLDDVVRWRCPALSKLKIKSTVSIEDLREFARKRYPESEQEDIAEEDVDMDIERPEILDTLDVSGLWEPSDDEEVDYSGYYDAEEELRVLFGCPDVTGCPRRRTRDDYDYY